MTRLRLVPPPITSSPVPCPAWCDKPAGHPYEWDVEHYTRIHECWLGDDDHAVRLSAAAYVAEIGDLEELELEHGIVVELPIGGLLSPRVARDLAADLWRMASLFQGAQEDVRAR